MTEFETMELIAMLIIFAPALVIYYFFKERKDQFNFMVSAAFVTFSFVFSVLEAFFFTELFNFLEHLFMVIAGIGFTFLLIKEFKTKQNQNYKILNSKKKMEGR